MTNKCAECGGVEFDIYIEADEFKRNGHAYTINIEYSICRQCGEEIIFPEQIKRNDCLIRDAWRKIDGLLTAQEIISLGKKLLLTQQKASKLFGGGVNAFSKYERSEVIQSVAMDKLMRSTLTAPDIFLWLKKQAGLPIPIQLEDTVLIF